MIDHITIKVKSLKVSGAFYQNLLSVLDYKLNIGDIAGSFCGFGIGKSPIIEIAQAKEPTEINKVHIAFKAQSKLDIEKFYQIALENGATCNGKPGYRTEYTPTYFAAFITDPDGNNIEVCLY